MYSSEFSGATGTLVGRIVLKGGAPPSLPPLVFDAESSEGCCETPMDDTNRSLVVDASGGIAWAVIEAKVRGAEVDGAGRVVALDQRCCRYEPHVVVVPKGGTMRYLNSDGITHNVHNFARKNSLLNNNVPAGSDFEVEVPYDEVIEHKCDIHSWMRSFVYVAEYPFTDVSGLDGSFEIAGLPPGEHSVTVWHESTRRGRVKAEITAGGRTEITIELSRK